MCRYVGGDVVTSPNVPPAQPVPGQPYQTAPLAASAVDQGAAAYQALVVAPWLDLVKDTIMNPGGPVDSFGALSGAAIWLRGVRDWIRGTLWPFIRSPRESLFGVYFDERDPWLVNYTQTVENLLTGTPYLVYAKIREMVGRAADAGTPLPQLAEQIDRTFLESGSPWWAGRSMVVARTEMRRAQMGGTFHAFEDFGRRENIIYVKKWLDSDDARVREAHEDTDGQVRLLGTPFMVGTTRGPKYPAMFPLDPSLPPELSIQCRCDMLIEERGEAPTSMTDRRFVSGGKR